MIAYKIKSVQCYRWGSDS